MPSDYRELFRSVRARPGMYFPSSDRYDVVVAFLLGCDRANAGGVLRGFEEWLLQRHGGQRNCAWSSLVRDVALGDRANLLLADMSEGDHELAITVLWDFLDEFLSESGTLLGTRKIYRGYWEWQQATGLAPEV